MFCKYCGMESATTDRCSWCHKTLTVVTEDASQTTSQGNTPRVAQATPRILVRGRPTPPPLNAPPPDEEITEEEPTIGTTPSSPAPTAQVPVAPIVATPAPTTPTPAARPVIGVRRPVAARPAVPVSMPPPAPAAPPEESEEAEAPPVVAAPKPPAAPAQKPHSPVMAPAPIPQRPVAPVVATPANRPSAPVVAPKPNPVVAAPPVAPTSRPAAPIEAPETPAVRTNRPAAPVAAPVASRPAVPMTVPRPKSAPANRPAAPVGGVAVATVPQTAPVSAPRPTAQPLAAQPQPAGYAPDLGRVTAQKSKYYQDVVIDPVSGTHYDLLSNKPTAELNPTQLPPAETNPRVSDIDLNWDAPSLSYGQTIGKFAGIFALILLFTAFVANTFETVYWIPLLLCNLVSGMLLPILRIGPWQDEDGEDGGWLFLGTLVLGPLISLIGYSLVFGLRRGGNPSVFGGLVVTLLARIGVELSVASPTLKHIFIPWASQGLHVTVFIVNWAGLATLTGWYMANSFHKLDE